MATDTTIELASLHVDLTAADEPAYDETVAPIWEQLGAIFATRIEHVVAFVRLSVFPALRQKT